VKDHAGNVTCFRNLKIVIGKTGFCVQDLSRYQKKILMNQKQSAMKRYELLKDLIIGGLDNEILVPIGTEFYPLDGYYMCDMIANKKPVVGKIFVHNNPQLFKEIVQRDWEVVSFELDGMMSTLRGDGKYHNEEGASSYEYALENQRIYSVQRLSDNEVFSVGDEIVWNWETSSIPSFIIKEFRIIVDGTLRVCCDNTNQDFISVSKKGLRKIVRTEPLPTTNKEEDSFQWTDENLAEFAFKYHDSFKEGAVTIWDEYIKQFIKSKSQPKEESKKERIEVVNIRKMPQNIPDDKAGLYVLHCTKSFHEDKFGAIKQAIEQVLNDEVWLFNKTYALSPEPTKLYTEKELLQAENKAFDAAREWEGGVPPTTLRGTQAFWNSTVKNKYPTFSAYKNSQSKTPTP
jgi:hypothetical protein